MFKQPISRILLIMLLSILTSCTTPSSPLNQYHAARPTDRRAFALTGIRHQALRDAALSTGARAGLAWRAKQINQIVAKHEKQLDLIFNFNAMLLDHNVLPPVLIEGRQTLEQSSDDIIRIADRSYSIQSQARFVTMAPTWRDYLALNYSSPDLPDSSLLPRNQSEKEVWNRYIDEGWQAGISQADIIFSESVGRLKRDYEGMIAYRTLLAQNMVSLPFVAQVNLGVTGGDSQMAINDRILRITALPQFNTAANEWKAEATPHLR